MTSDTCEVAVVGAGPYGLAAAAHLKAARVSTRIFGDTMSFWRKNMPSGMKLRSPWRASHIRDPRNELSLDAFAEAEGIPRTENLSLVDFVRYGEWFQQRAVRDLDRRMVRFVVEAPRGFRLTLDDGSVVEAGRVVLAMGLSNQHYVPAEFAQLPAELVSHSSDFVAPTQFANRHVAVIGRGQSACESAVLLHEAGAQVDLISRGAVRWLGAEAVRPRWNGELMWRVRQMLHAPSGIGPFPYSWAADMPDVLYRLPATQRKRLTELCLRPAASGWLQTRSHGVQINAGKTIKFAQAHGSRVRLQLNDGTADFDHVVLATGYRIDIARLGVLGPELLRKISARDGCPVLSTLFESSVPGLHFVGCSAVGSFGPLPRFVAGCGFAAKRVAKACAAAPARKSPAFSRGLIEMPS